MIKMSEQNDMSPDKFSNVGSMFNINPIDIVMYLLSKWYWFVLSIALFGGYAWYQYAKTPYYYSRSATVMIKGASRQMRSNGLDRFQTTSYTNVANEILQLKSYKLMRDVVTRLNANIDYVVMDGFREKELYTQSPIQVSFVDDNRLPANLTITPVNQTEVQLTKFDKDESLTLKAQLGDTIQTPAGHLVVSSTLYHTDEWYGKPISIRKNTLDAAASHFLSNLSVTQTDNDAAVLYTALRDFSTVRAEDVLNTLITIYNEETIKDKNQIAINTENFINERLVKITKELDDVETQIETFKLENDMIDVGSAASMSMSQKQQFTSQAKELEMQKRMSGFIKDYLTDPSKATELIPANTGIDMNIESQIAAYNLNKLKRDKLIEGSSDKNPVVQELNKSLNAMRQNIIRAVDNTIVSLDTKLNEAEAMRGQAAYRVSNIPKQQREMLNIDRQHRIKEELYLYLLNKREENALAQATTETDARVLDPAGGSDTPVSPNGRAIIMGGVMKGAALPLVILLAMLFFDTRIRNRKDIEDATNVPFLGEIPKDTNKKTKKVDGKKEDIVVRVHGRDIVSEAFRIIRTNMDFMRVKSKNLQVVTFSSFGPGAGKTYVSTNLAASFAQTNKKVILIDLDIRKGTLSSRTKRDHTKGMTSYLSGQAGIDDIIQKDGVCENLDLISAGPTAPNPSELLLSERLEELIAELRTRYDYIFIDNVPVGIIADAAITNRVADLTIFVVRVGKLDRRMLPELEKIYRSKQLNNMSLILNGAITNKIGYGGYGYGYGYGYDMDEKKGWTSMFKKS